MEIPGPPRTGLTAERLVQQCGDVFQQRERLGERSVDRAGTLAADRRLDCHAEGASQNGELSLAARKLDRGRCLAALGQNVLPAGTSSGISSKAASSATEDGFKSTCCLAARRTAGPLYERRQSPGHFAKFPAVMTRWPPP